MSVKSQSLVTTFSALLVFETYGNHRTYQEKYKTPILEPSPLVNTCHLYGFPYKPLYYRRYNEHSDKAANWQTSPTPPSQPLP